MNIFGWVYLVLTVLGGISVINEIGKPRKPISQTEAAAKLLFSGLAFWALYAWGLTS